MQLRHEAKLGLGNGCKILSCNVAKFNARREISFCRIKIYMDALA
ncbi:hypothetical protein CAMGR0001_2196 [Campylobacter gracilis RM3268]|uniref:Uncharacterized protein n=1 Tax=Campylobacter gracilis RM3268 TaxID=553220 RepID=C8PH08_9BACT|nr:hypothetical protein CAMGR0001_2196 [Campylobacter gracilis RM3268]